MSLFKRYKKRENNKVWNRKEILTVFKNELKSFNCKLENNTLIIPSDDILIKLIFNSNNYAKENEIDLNANIVFTKGDIVYEWVDLFHLIKSLQKAYSRPLNIRKDEEWNGSSLQLQFSNIINPLIGILKYDSKRQVFLKGEQTDYNGTVLKLSSEEDYGWIKNDSVRLMDWLVRKY